MDTAYDTQMNTIGYMTEMEFAQRVQTGLLPKRVPAVEGLDLWATIQPAFQVGGDYYDFFPGQDQSMTIAISDNCGKGLSAAILMSMTRTVIRSLANLTSGLSPEEIILSANRLLYEDLTNTVTFATLFIGKYEPASKRLVYANAGHSPVIYIPHGSAPQLLSADGVPLGVLEESGSKNHWLEFKGGDCLIIGTDGLLNDQHQNGYWDGYERLLQKITSLSDLPARLIAEKLIHRASHNHPSVAADDQTIIVIKCL